MTWNDQTEKDVKNVREKLGLNQLENEVPLSAMLSMEQPVLVTADSNVSGKMYLAAELEQFHSIGMDAVASACNELYAMQARPLLFSDSIACARPKAEKIREIESGVEQACIQGSVRYTGSQIRDLPEFFSYDQYDLTGFAVGIRDKAAEAEQIPFSDGDVIIGLPSNGLHNSGYIVARKKLYLSKATMESYYETLGTTLGELLLQPTRLYRTQMETLRKSKVTVKSCVPVAHGGLDRAARRLLRHQAGAVLKLRTASMMPLYEMLHQDGNISDEQMRETFNMGYGMLFVVAEEDVDTVVEALENIGERPEPFGLVERDSYNIRYIKG